MTVVIDYDAGNLKSVERSLREVGARFEISADPALIRRADKLVFPGVGEAAHAMAVLKKREIDQAIGDSLRRGIPLLAICIGSQILLDESFEAEQGTTACLSIESGSARSFNDDFEHAGLRQSDGRKYKVPHMGWNQVKIRQGHPASGLFKGIPDNSSFYFVHSFYPAPSDADIALGTTEYGLEFVSAYARHNMVATQFHPEKSGEVGLKLLSNFIHEFGGSDA